MEIIPIKTIEIPKEIRAYVAGWPLNVFTSSSTKPIKTNNKSVPTEIKELKINSFFIFLFL